MRKIQKLFLDIEWNQPNNTFRLNKCDMLQIAGIGYSEDDMFRKRYAKHIRPRKKSRISSKTYALMHLSKEELRDALALPEVISEFWTAFSSYEILIVWSRNAYELLVHTAKYLGRKMPKYRLVVLQEVIGTLSRTGSAVISFEKALEHFEIEFRPEDLHCARNDVEYLQKLYRKCEASYRELCEVDGDLACFRAADSTVLHEVNCHYTKRISSKQLIKADRTEVFLGMEPCKSCQSEGRFRKFDLSETVKKKKKVKETTPENSFTDAKIYEQCKKWHLTCHIGLGVICVNTGKTAWRIYHDGKAVTAVYHENYSIDREPRYKKAGKANEGFHQQKMKLGSLDEVLRSICEHDKHHLRQKKKSGVDRIIDEWKRTEHENGCKVRE